MEELERLLANMIRIGRVSAIDEANARVKMDVGGLTTDWLPWGEARAGATRTWSMPRPGEQRVVFAPYGDTGQAFVGPAIYQDDHPAPASSKDKETTVFPDGTTFEYDSASNTYTQTVAGSGNWVFNLKHATINAAEDATVNTKLATVKASTSVTLDTPDSFLKGKLTVDGLITGKAGVSINGAAQFNGGGLTHNGKNVGSNHTHSGVATGSGTSGPPT